MAHTIIVVPCFNEELRLSVDSFSSFVTAHADVQFLMVNDGSQDGTLRVLRKLNSEYPGRIQILNLQQNMGKAEAVRRGCCAALEQQPEYIGYWDADLAASLQAIMQFRDVLDRCPEIQLVIGARIPLLGHAVARGLVRHCMGRLFARCAALILGLSIYDTQAGHKVFRVSDRLRQAFASPFHARWIFDVELLARWIGRRERTCLQQAQRTIYEFPLEAWRDVAGSKLKSSDFVRAFFELSTIGRIYLLASATGPGMIASDPISPQAVPLSVSNV